MARRRTVIDVSGLGHRTPIPLGARVGNIVHSSPIYGRDNNRDLMPDDPDEQARCMFANLQQFMQAAGGTMEDIVHIKLFLKDFADRDAVDRTWVQAFPDDDDRPSRHAVSEPEVRGGGALFAIEVLAVVE